MLGIRVLPSVSTTSHGHHTLAHVGAHRYGYFVCVKSGCGRLPARLMVPDRGSQLHSELGTGQGCQPLRIPFCAWLHQLIHL